MSVKIFKNNEWKTVSGGGSGGGTPAIYIKKIEKNGSTSITWTNKDGSTETFTPSTTGEVTKEYVDNKVSAEKTRAETAETTLNTAITTEKTRAEGVEAGKIDLLGSVPGHTDLPYNLPYFFETTGNANKVTVTAKTISLDNKKTQGTYSLDVNSATTTNAGLMSASDKTRLEGTAAQTDLTTTNANLASEVSTRQTQVATLTNDLNAEVTRATTAEGTKVDKITGTSAYGKSYVVNADGTQGSVSITENGSVSSLVKTTNNGKIVLASDPTADSHAARKGYVDTKISGLPDGVTITWTADNKLKAALPEVMTLKGQKNDVSELPDPANTGDIWFVKIAASTSSEMYCWIDSTTKYVNVGSTSVDLSAYETSAHASSTYATKTDLTTETTARVAGEASLQTQINGCATSTELTNQVANLQSQIDGKQSTLSATNKLDPNFINTTVAQNNAINSGITSDLVSKIPTSTSKLDPANINFTTEQSSVLNSGITSTKVTTYDSYATSKQDLITDTNKLPASKVSGLATVATTGSYADLTNKPTIPTKTSQLTNDSSFITSSYHDSTKLDATKSTYQTTAPTAAITDGGVHIVYLTAEPTTKYAGYVYLIKE